MEDYKELFDEIISLAWRNFIRKFRRGEIMVSEKSLSEVMFQFCFANEIFIFSCFVPSVSSSISGTNNRNFFF